MRAADQVLVLGVLVLWGVWGVVLKFAMRDLGIQVLFWTQIVQLPIFLAYLAAIGKLWPLHFSGVGLLAAIAAGVLVGVGSVLFYVLLAHREVSVVFPLTALYPGVTAALGMTLLGEGVSASKLLGIGLALIAAVLLTRA